MKGKIVSPVFKMVITLIVLYIYAGCSREQTENENLPVLNMEFVKNNGITAIDNKFHNYYQAYCNFLKNSSALNPDDIRDVFCSVNDLYLLFLNSIRHYDLHTGNLLFEYNTPEQVNFVDFAFNQTTQKFCLLDNKNSRVIELTMDGEITKTIQLEKSHRYSKIEHINEQSFLVTVQTIPYPTFVTVNFENNEVKKLLPETDTTQEKHDIPENSDSIWISYPLYVTNKSPRGIMIKYLFDDRVYLCNQNEIKPDHCMNLGTQKIKLRNRWTNTKIKNNDHFRIKKFWYTNKKTYVISQYLVKIERGVFDYKGLSLFRNFKNVDDYGDFIANNMLATLTPNKENIFMDDECKRFLSFKKISKKEKRNKKKWPLHMLEAENKEDLVVSVFYMK